MKKTILIALILGLFIIAKSQCHNYAFDSETVSPQFNNWTVDTTYLNVSFKVIEPNNPFESQSLFYYTTIPIALPNNIIPSTQYDTVYVRIRRWVDINYNNKW